MAISIHSPHAGRDAEENFIILCLNTFQSTLPMRGETVAALAAVLEMHISIHSPHAGRDIHGVSH